MAGNGTVWRHLICARIVELYWKKRPENTRHCYDVSNLALFEMNFIFI